MSCVFLFFSFRPKFSQITFVDCPKTLAFEWGNPPVNSFLLYNLTAPIPIFIKLSISKEFRRIFASRSITLC